MRRMYLLCLAGLMTTAGCNSNRPVAYEYDEYEGYLQSVGCNAGNPDCVSRHSQQYASGIGYTVDGRYYAGGENGGVGGGYAVANGLVYADDGTPGYIGPDGRFYPDNGNGGYIGPDGLFHPGNTSGGANVANVANSATGVLYVGGKGNQSGARYVTLDGKLVKEVKFSNPAGNDLKLETAEYVLQVEGVPNKRYDYYVWTGEKQYTDDPDLIIQDGTAAILVEE